MSQKNKESKDQKDQTQNMSQNTILPQIHPLLNNTSDKLISYIKYSNKSVEGIEPNKNNDDDYIYPTLNENDQEKYNAYLNMVRNIFETDPN